MFISAERIHTRPFSRPTDAAKQFFFFFPSKKPFRRTYGPTPRPQQVNHVTPLIATTDLKAATGTGLGVDRPKIVPRVPERARVPLVAMVYVRDREHPPRRTLCFSQRRHAAGSYSLLFKGRFAGKFYHLSRTALFQRRWRLSSNPFGSIKYGGCSRLRYVQLKHSSRKSSAVASLNELFSSHILEGLGSVR